MTRPEHRGRPLPVVALVCSLGGADALLRVLAPLPASLPAAVVALQHLDPRYASTLPERLDRSTALQVRVAADGARLEEGVVDVAPPGRHVLLAGDDTLLLVNSGPRAVPRPSADLLLVSMAAVLGPRLLAVVLSGTGDDGAVGAQVVTRYGGRTLVQDEESSQAYGMPAATVASDSPGLPVPLDELADVILRAVRGPAQSTESPPPREPLPGGHRGPAAGC
jgi:two-component system chemotaxis response regulator CheB